MGSIAIQQKTENQTFGVKDIFAYRRMRMATLVVSGTQLLSNVNSNLQLIFQQPFLSLQWFTWAFHTMLQSYLETFGGIMQSTESSMLLQMALELSS